VAPIRISLIDGCCLQGSYWTKGSCWLSWCHHFESFTFATMTWWTVMEYLCNKWINEHGYGPLDVNTSRSFPHSWLITRFITRLTQRVSLVKQELLTLPEHLSPPPVFNWGSLCFVTSRTPNYQKAKSSGMYNLARSNKEGKYWTKQV